MIGDAPGARNAVAAAAQGTADLQGAGAREGGVAQAVEPAGCANQPALTGAGASLSLSASSASAVGAQQPQQLATPSSSRNASSEAAPRAAARRISRSVTDWQMQTYTMQTLQKLGNS